MAVEPQGAQPELKAQVEAQVIFELAFRYLRELWWLAVAVVEARVLDQVAAPEAVWLVAPVKPVKALAVPEALKMPAVREVCHMGKVALAPQAIGELVAPEDLVHCTVVAVAVADTTAVAVAVPTKIGAAPMPEAAVADRRTLTLL
jgi:hypothetical protein